MKKQENVPFLKDYGQNANRAKRFYIKWIWITILAFALSVASTTVFAHAND
jgi:hypothetical protein